MVNSISKPAKPLNSALNTAPTGIRKTMSKVGNSFNPNKPNLEPMPHIRQIFRFFSLACLLFSLTACFEERIVVKVGKTGAGVVDHRSYNSAQELMSGLLGEKNIDSEAAESAAPKFDDAYFAKKAQSMGKGVKVKSWKLASNGTKFQGYEAQYTFSDINKLRISTAPSSLQNNIDASSVDSGALEADHRFTMKNGLLTVHTPEPESEENQEELADQANTTAAQKMLPMMASMFEGARVSVEIEALDKIKKTNAHHRNGDRITIMDVRLDTLISSPEMFIQAQKFKSLGRSEAQALADKIDGLDIDTQAEIKIQF